MTFSGIKNTALESVVGGLCQYEVVALISRYTGSPRCKLPPLTVICRRHKWLAPVLVAGLTVHLYRQSWRAVDLVDSVEAIFGDVESAFEHELGEA